MVSIFQSPREWGIAFRVPAIPDCQMSDVDCALSDELVSMTQ